MNSIAPGDRLETAKANTLSANSRPSTSKTGIMHIYGTEVRSTAASFLGNGVSWPLPPAWQAASPLGLRLSSQTGLIPAIAAWLGSLPHPNAALPDKCLACARAGGES